MKCNLQYSHQIRNMNYDQGNGMLSINFLAGNTQDYYTVPDNVYRKLEASSHQNEFYENKIYGNYPIGPLR